MGLTIISGGQTGVDRAALDAAMELGIPCGGWCPEGRKAEDGVIPERYPFKELQGGGYSQRTIKNVEDSDGTVIIYFNAPSGGTEQTLAICIKRHKSYLLIDASELSSQRAGERVIEFISVNQIKTLNVAGPRASGNREAYTYTYDAIVNSGMG